MKFVYTGIRLEFNIVSTYGQYLFRQSILYSKKI